MLAGHVTRTNSTDLSVTKKEHNQSDSELGKSKATFSSFTICIRINGERMWGEGAGEGLEEMWG